MENIPDPKYKISNIIFFFIGFVFGGIFFSSDWLIMKILKIIIGDF